MMYGECQYDGQQELVHMKFSRNFLTIFKGILLGNFLEKRQAIEFFWNLHKSRRCIDNLVDLNRPSFESKRKNCLIGMSKKLVKPREGVRSEVFARTSKNS